MLVDDGHWHHEDPCSGKRDLCVLRDLVGPQMRKHLKVSGQMPPKSASSCIPPVLAPEALLSSSLQFCRGVTIAQHDCPAHKEAFAETMPRDVPLESHIVR